MSTPISLIRSILGEAALSDADASAVLEGAARLSVDPIDRCIHHYGLSAAVAMERAAAWAGLPYSALVPQATRGSASIRRIDALADVRTIRARLDDGEMVFCAPRFAELIRLAAYIKDRPELRERVCLVPIEALRAEVAESNAARLVEEARQRLARRWPFASAHLDLPLAARITFVIGVVAAAIAAALAPFWFKPVFMPLVGILLVVPALVRLVAAAYPQDTDPEAVHGLSDAELPVYSVLIPLRDEAQMVPLLERAMHALDYPALCIKRTKAR